MLLYRRLRYGYPFRRIRLDVPKYAIVDPADYYQLRQHRWVMWSNGRNCYAIRWERTEGSRKLTIVRMHREICQPGEGIVVDHINYEGMDNRGANLRPATRAQNTCHRRKYGAKTSSKYKGVHWSKRRKKWCAQICLNNRKIRLGHFTDEDEAARAYDEAAKKYHGEFASLNFESEI